MENGDRQIIANIDRLNALMDREQLAAVVARSGQNFTYLSGIAYPGTLARHLDLPDSSRGVMILWPRHGEPVIVLNKTAAGLTRRDAWVKTLEVYEGYVESPYDRLCDVLARAGLERERVGFEKSYVSAHDWEHIQHRLPGLRMVDCTRTMDKVRWIKTPGEIALLKRAADLLDDAYLDVFPTIRGGDSERSVHARLIFQCLEKGAGWAHGILNSSTNTIPYAGESDVVFRKGDVVRTDYVAYLDGYPGHQSRNAILGQPTSDQLREYRLNRDIYRAAIERCRPGVKAGDIYEFVVGEFKKHGYEHKSLLSGHGVGPWWHQQEPIIARGNDTPLEEGMVLAMEPHLGYWHLQDMIVVRRDGPELLSDKFPTDEPFIIDS